MGKLTELTLIIWLGFSIFLGAVIFSKGFLLSRQVISKKSHSCSNNHHHPWPYDNENDYQINEEEETNPGNTNGSRRDSRALASMIDWCREENAELEPEQQFSKVILVLIDALRFDFIRRMKFLSNDKNSTSIRAQSFRFLADPPTTTMQRLKALMTGTMPTFIDASSNFNSYEVEEDSFIYQLHSAGKRTAFLGDDTWLSLFPRKLFTSPYVEAHPSFNAWDLDTVDRAVNASLQQILKSKSAAKEWDVIIAHFLGVDHAGHRYGPKHPEMQRKLEEADVALQFIFSNMPEDTLLVVFGDHGMTKTGDHGGDSTDEIEAGLVFLTKNGKMAEIQNPPEITTVSQIDLVPTLSAIFRLPIPYSSIGQIIPGIMNGELYTNALAANVAQVNRYITAYSELSGLNLKDKTTLSQAYSEVEAAFLNNSSDNSQFVQLSRTYLQLVKSIAVNTWTQFNFVAIGIGIFVCSLCLAALFVFLTAGEPVQSSLWGFATLTACISTVSAAYFLTTPGIQVFIIVGTIAAVVMLMLLQFSNVSQDTQVPKQKISGKFIRGGLPELIPITLYLISCLGVFSNSFVINEGYVLGAVLILTALTQLLTSRSRSEVVLDDARFPLSLLKARHKYSWLSFFLLAGIVRFGHLFFRCREELVDCQEEFLLHKHIPSLPSDWAVHKYVRFGEALLSLAVLVVGFRHHMMSRNCIGSSRPASVISKYIPSVLVVLVCAHWALQGLPFGLAQTAQNRFLNFFPPVFQMVTLVSMLVIWVRPLCCIGRIRPFLSHTQILQVQDLPSQSQTKKSRNRPGPYNNSTIAMKRERETASSDSRYRDRTNGRLRNKEHRDANHGEENNVENGGGGLVGLAEQDTLSEDVFSSALLVHGILTTLLAVQVSSSGLTPIITVIPYAVVCLLNLSRGRMDSWATVVNWTLATQYFFYATAHQPVFSAIPWDSAFIGKSENLGNMEEDWLSWVRPGLAVLGNLHVSQIIFSACLPLVAYWNGEPETLMGRREKREAYLIGGKFILLHGVKVLACMGCAALHRRHLMVWKIFAPKFIFEGISFFVVLLGVVGGLVFITRVDYLFRSVLAVEKRRIGHS